MTSPRAALEEPLVISTFKDRHDARPKLQPTTWQTLVKSLTRHLRIADKNEAQLWSPAVYPKGAHRDKESVECVSVLAFDIDDGTDTPSIEYWLGDLCYVISSSFSHTPAHPKLRVIIRLGEPIPRADFDSVWRRANQHLLHAHVDPSTKDESRMFYRPSCPPSAEPVAIVHDGQSLDWRKLPPLPAPKAMPRRIPSAPPGASNDQKRAAALLSKWEHDLAAVPPDTARHNTLLQLARAAGGLIASELLPEQDVIDALSAASRSNGLEVDDGELSVRKTITDGIAHGMREPWTPDDLPDSPNWRASRRFQRTARGLVDTSTGELLADPHVQVVQASPVEIDDEAPRLAAVPEFPIDVLPPQLRELVAAAHLPAALVAGAGLGALAAAIGGKSVFEVGPAWLERPILWLALLAPRGAGKSPAMGVAYKPLHDHDDAARSAYEEQLAAFVAAKGKGDPPKDPTLVFGESTLEALARRLASNSTAALYYDELSTLLRGLGEYKRGGGGDRGRFLSLWDGRPWSVTRVGRGGGPTNAVDLRIAAPTVSVCGGLQTLLHELLGDEIDGMRPRWLVHLARLPDAPGSHTGQLPQAWATLLEGLIAARRRERSWVFDDSGRERFVYWQRQWKTLANREDETASTSAALHKADRQLARVSHVLAEGWAPGLGGVVPAAIVDRAAVWIEFTLDCWRALPETGGLALSRRDEQLDQGCTRLADWLEQHGGRATRRALLRQAVAGVRTANDLNALLERYAAIYPGTVLEESSSGGRPPILVCAPPRRPSGVLGALSALTKPLNTSAAPESADFEIEQGPGEGQNGRPEVSKTADKATLSAVDGGFVSSQNGSVRPVDIACRACGKPLLQAHEIHLELHSDCTLPWPSA